MRSHRPPRCVRTFCEGPARSVLRASGGQAMRATERGTATGLSAREWQALDGIRAHHPDLEGLFLSSLGRARSSALHRLLQGLVMEDVGGIGVLARWREGYLEIPLSGGKTLCARVERRYSMGTFDLCGGLVLRGEGAEQVIEHPLELLDLMKSEGFIPEGATGGDLSRFRREVDDGVANHALSLAGAEPGRRAMARRAGGTGADTSLEWVRRRMEEDETFSPLAFYEQLVVDGHPLHPCAKLKMGVSVEDALRYSPEFGARPGAVLVAVAKDRCEQTSSDDQTMTDILREEHPEAAKRADEALRARGSRPEDYALVPVHPWQLEHVLPELYAGPMRRGEVVPVAGARVPARALMSFRSLAPIRRRGEGKHHFKTAVNVRLTNAVRTVSRASVENAAELTRLLRKVQRDEGYFGGRFVVLEERAGACYRPPEGTEPGRFAVLSKNLAAILREDTEDHLGANEVAMPASALLAGSPFGKGPVLAEVVGEFAEARGMASRAEACLSFLRSYCGACLPGFLTMMVRHGIGLEGHLQNSVPVFRRGEPVRMLVRDFGGVRLLRERMPGGGVRLYPGSEIEAADEDDLRDKVFYPVFLNHLGGICARLSGLCGVEEARLWAVVAEVCRSVLRDLGRDPRVRSRALSDGRALFAPGMRLKALTTMRLLGGVTDYAFAETPNPLASTEEKWARFQD